MTVTFIELQGKDASARLEHLQEELRSGENVVQSELLESVEQPGLFLLVCRCRTKLELPALEGARVWSFRPAGENREPAA